jgi:hypothetical protein
MLQLLNNSCVPSSHALLMSNISIMCQNWSKLLEKGIYTKFCSHKVLSGMFLFDLLVSGLLNR